MFIQYLDLNDKSHKMTKYLSFDEALNLATEKPSMIGKLQLNLVKFYRGRR